MRYPTAPFILRSLLFTALFLWGCGFAWAGGSQEDPITTAQKYITDKQYDQALNILSEIIKNDPEKLDLAQSLVNQVLTIKGGYNQVLQELVNTLKNDPGNYNKALDLINKASAMDPNPSAKIKQQLEGFRITAKLNKVRYDKNQIMARGLIQVQAKKYVEAVDIYLGGFDLAADDFALGSQTEEFRKAVMDQTALVRQSVTALKTENVALQPSLASFADDIKAGRDGLDRLGTRFPAFAEQFLRTVSQTSRLEKAADDMTGLRQSSDQAYPPDNPNYNYNEYIRIIQELMQGPAGKTGQGIRYAARSLIDSEYQGILDSLTQLYSASKLEFEALTRTSGDSDLSQSLRLVILSGAILMRAQGLQGNLDLGTAPGFADIALKLPAQYRTTPAVILGELKAYQQLQADTSLAATLRRLKASKAATVWQEAITAWDGGNAGLAQWEKEIRLGMDSGLLDNGQYQRLKGIFGVLHETSQNGLLALAREHFGTAVALQLAQLRQLFAAQAPDEKRANDLLNGVVTGQQGILRYPDQAQALFNAIKGRLVSQLGALDLLDKDIGGQRADISGAPAIQATVSASQVLRREIQAAIARMDVGAGKAQANLQLAQDSIQKALQAMGLADAAIAGAKPDLASADKNYSTASDLYFRAFDLAYNAEQRLAADRKLSALQERIETARNNLLTAQIRELITGTTDYFNREEYQRAFDLILQAEDLDNQTAGYKNIFNVAYQKAVSNGRTVAQANTDATDSARNQEIKYWKNRIQAATNLSSERSISEADPTAGALINYLNRAQLDYGQIAQLLNGGKKEQAKALVARARQNIENVLLVKPNNWDAKLLRLRVEQVSDPATFKALFPKRVSDTIGQARDAMKKGDTAQVTKSYTDLQSLRELDPRYPGISDAIFDLEVAMGTRDSPLTTARKNQAAALVLQATQLANSGKQADLPTARNLANQAFALDPTNTKIGPLLDVISSRVKSAELRLTFEEEQQFNLAQSQYLAGNLGAAYRTIQPLQANHPTMDRVTKLAAQINRELGR